MFSFITVEKADQGGFSAIVLQICPLELLASSYNLRPSHLLAPLRMCHVVTDVRICNVKHYHGIAAVPCNSCG